MSGNPANAVETDAMSTSLFVLGMEKSKAVLRGLPRRQALFIPDKRPIEVWITPGMRRFFTAEPAFKGAVRSLE